MHARCARRPTSLAGSTLSISSRTKDRLCQNLGCAAAAERLRSRTSRQARRTSDMADRGLGGVRRPRAGVLFPVGTGRPTRPLLMDQARRPGGPLTMPRPPWPRSLRSDDQPGAGSWPTPHCCSSWRLLAPSVSGARSSRSPSIIICFFILSCTRRRTAPTCS